MANLGWKTELNMILTEAYLDLLDRQSKAVPPEAPEYAAVQSRLAGAFILYCEAIKAAITS